MNLDIPVLKFFYYLIWFTKYWHIANFANFFFRHKQQAKVNLEQTATKSLPFIFWTSICQFWNFFDILSGSQNIGTLRISFFAITASKSQFRGKCHKKYTNYFFNPKMPVLEFSNISSGSQNIGTLRILFFCHKQQAKVNLEQNATKSPLFIFWTSICQFWNFFDILSSAPKKYTLPHPKKFQRGG